MTLFQITDKLVISQDVGLEVTEGSDLLRDFNPSYMLVYPFLYLSTEFACLVHFDIQVMNF